MSRGTLNLMTLNQKQFLKFAYAFLGLAFLLMMLQNVIRYGAYDRYQPLRSLFYLINSMLLFVPVLPLIIWIAKKYLLKKARYYVPLGALLILLSIGSFYLYSSFSLFVFDYYEEVFSAKYARNYFSREALLHLIVLTSALFFVWNYKERRTETQMISGSLGRKKMSLPLSSILWIEANDHYLNLHGTEMTLLKRSTMKEMEETLKPDFLRIHRKYLVNRKAVSGQMKDKRANYLLLNSGKKLKIGSSYLSVLAEFPFHDK